MLPMLGIHRLILLNQHQGSHLKQTRRAQHVRNTSGSSERNPPDPQDPSMERHTDRERATAREASLRGDLRDMEKLLSNIPTLQDTNQESKHIDELAKLAQKAQITIRDLGANHRDEVTNAEIDA